MPRGSATQHRLGKNADLRAAQAMLAPLLFASTTSKFEHITPPLFLCDCSVSGTQRTAFVRGDLF